MEQAREETQGTERQTMTPKRDTGFHPSDPDWTRGRGQYVADAEAIARMQMGMTRKVALATKEKEPNDERA